MNLLLLDNYDSFTFNLLQAFAELGAEVCVERNDALTVVDCLARRPAGVILSPGPGRPEQAGICLPLVRACAEAEIPLLGVCLGHQALALAYGASLERAARVMHGKTSGIRHGGSGLFRGLGSPFEAMRYHSLVVRADTLPAELEVSAWSDIGEVMGLRHRALPLAGVQFHPESICSPTGQRLLANFLADCGTQVAV